MKKSIQKDSKKRLVCLKNERQKKILKSLVFNETLPKSIRWKANLDYYSMPKNSSLTRVKNRCLITGRGRFLIGGYNLSRLMVRKLARDGKIPGLQKSSW